MNPKVPCLALVALISLTSALQAQEPAKHDTSARKPAPTDTAALKAAHHAQPPAAKVKSKKKAGAKPEAPPADTTKPDTAKTRAPADSAKAAPVADTAKTPKP